MEDAKEQEDMMAENTASASRIRALLDDLPNQQTFTYQDFEDYQPNYNRNYNTQQYYSYDNNGNNYNDNKKLSLDDIEKSVLKKRYKNDDVNTRLSRIENKLFQTDFQEDDESTRLNRISMAHTAQKASNAYKGAGLQEKMATVMQIGMTVLMILAMVL